MISHVDRWLSMAITTEDVKSNCDDLKVLGKGDFKALVKWRLSLRREVCQTPDYELGVNHILGSSASM